MVVVAISEHVHEVVASEREVVITRLVALREQSERLHALAERVDVELEENTRLLRQIDEILGLAPQLAIEVLHTELRGQRLREIAVALLRQRRDPGAVIHYTEWYDLLVAAGLRIGGKDPVATFLTQISKAPEVESVRRRSGLYRLRSA